ncbi:MAG: PEGA domain-containing protein [Polyangiales bacterium]
MQSLSRRLRACFLGLIVALVCVQLSSPLAYAGADETPTARARVEFLAGTDFVKHSQWGEALAAFERSAALRPHALTMFNMGACERALGHYTRARRMLKGALDQNDAHAGKELAASTVGDANAWLAEIQRLLVHVALAVRPTDSTIAVDGRPLVVDEGDKTVWIAGLAAPGAGSAIPSETFTVLVDPGVHVFAVSKKGFSDAIVNRTLNAGEPVRLAIELDRLRATIRVAADHEDASVSIDGEAVGVAPIEIARAAGSHRVVVSKVGFTDYVAVVEVNPGEEANLRATLAEAKPGLTSRWWFWAGASVLVVGAATGTYLLTRPAPTRPAPDGGGLGWVVIAR